MNNIVFNLFVRESGMSQLLLRIKIVNVIIFSFLIEKLFNL